MTAICDIVIEKTFTLKKRLFSDRLLGHKLIIPRRGPRFELQLLGDRQEAARVVGGV